MAFGAELKDFVSGFKTGYEMIDSQEEKDWKREERRMKKEGFELDKQNSAEDRAFRRDNQTYQRGRDAQSDKRYEREFDWKQDARDWERKRDGVRDETDAQREAQRRKEREEDRSDKRRLLDDERQRQLGVLPDDATIERLSGGSDEEPARPGSDEQSSYGGGEALPVQLASYGGGNDRGGSRGEPRTNGDIARSLVRDLQRDFGIPQHAAVGIVGQLAAETGGFTQMQELKPTVPGSRGGFGYAQWTGPRRKSFEAHAEDPTSYTDNYQFLRHELSNTSESRVMAKLKNARNSEEAGRIFTDTFLRPGVKNYGGRRNWTRRVEGLLGSAVSAARGGLITAIPDDEEPEDFGAPMPPDPEDEQEVATALPEDGPTPTPRPAYDGAMEGDAEEPTDDPYELGRRAVRDGLKQAIKDTGMDQEGAIEDPDAEKRRLQYIRGYGAAPSQMMRQVIDKIDPKREMAPGERNMKAMGTVYKYYMETGDTEKAQKAAASMVQYYRQSSQQFLSLAQAAAEGGDLDKAAQAAVAAYANVPNGRDLDIEEGEDGSYTISVTDAKTGKAITKQVLPPNEFAAAAMGFNPSTFDDAILNAAGAPADTYSDASIEDRETVATTAKGTVEEGLADSGLDEVQQRAVGDIGSDIAARKENGMDADQAVRLSANLIDPNNKISMKPSRGNPDLVEVTTDGFKVVVRKGYANQIEKLRAANEKSAKAVADEETANKKWWSDQGDLLRRGIGAFGGAMDENRAKRDAERDARAKEVESWRERDKEPAVPKSRVGRYNRAIPDD